MKRRIKKIYEILAKAKAMNLQDIMDELFDYPEDILAYGDDVEKELKRLIKIGLVRKITEEVEIKIADNFRDTFKYSFYAAIDPRDIVRKRNAKKH